MTYAQLVSHARFLTGGITTSDWSAAEITVSLNNWYHKVVSIILDSQDDWDFDDPNHANASNFPKAFNLTANTQLVSLDVLTNKILKVSRVDVSYDGTNWYKAEPIDQGEIGTAIDSTTVNNNFSTTKPYYDLQGTYIYLYPIPTASVTSGLRVFYTREVDEFTTSDTTQEPGFDEPFHAMLSIGAAVDWETSRKSGGARLSRLEQMFQDYEFRLRGYYGAKQKDRKPQLKAAFINYE